MTGLVKNGYRAHLKCDGLHDGEAGFQEPTPVQASEGARLVAAFWPNAGKRPRGPVLSGGKTYTCIRLERSTDVQGLVVLLLKEA